VSFQALRKPMLAAHMPHGAVAFWQADCQLLLLQLHDYTFQAD
jgi:hypothetical protein